MSEQCAALLATLIGYDTQNPGGDEVALCRHLAGELAQRGADHVEVVKVPRPGTTGGFVYARFGEPRLLINAHVDTVPANTGWSQDPLVAAITDDRVVGLGACDTKGAIAAILVALARQRPDGVGVLFSGDEERSTTVMQAFLASGLARGVERAVVCEPTGRQIGVRHRGVGAFRATLRGAGGHSSGADRMPRPIATLARLAVALDDLGISLVESGPDEMQGLCMNIAGLDGGVAFNVVPDRGELTWSVRPPPGFDMAGLGERQAALAAAVDVAIELATELDLPAFATRDIEAFRPLLGDRLDLTVPLQFWTEAAVLAAAGVDAVVLGPGEIARAHAPDEMVPLADLDWAVELFVDLFAASRSAPR